MLRIDHVLGSRLEPAFSEEIHRLEHHGAVDVVNIPAADLRGAGCWRRRAVARNLRSPCRATRSCSTGRCC